MLTSSQQHPPRTNHTSHQDEPHIPSGRITHPLSTSHTYPLSTNHTSIQDESHIPSGRITRPLRTNCTFKTVLHQFHSSPSSTHKSLNHEPTAGSQFWTRRRAPFAVQLGAAPFQRVPSCVAVEDSCDCRVTPSTCSS